MVGSEHAEELLQIEEADAWPEYPRPRARRARRGTPSRAVGLGLASRSGCAPSVRAARLRPAAA